MTLLGEISIDGRFRGPPESANGGYVAGRLAAFVDAPAVEVRLAAPPPLDRPLAVHGDGDGVVELRDGADIVALAQPGHLDLDVPAFVDHDAAVTARARFLAGYDPAVHPFPSCFGCGPQRDRGDALVHMSGLVRGRDDEVLACPMTTDAELPHAGGVLEPAVVWAALDCTSGWAAVPPGSPAHVLGTFTAQIERQVRVGEPHVVVSWGLGADGRKRYSAAAIFDDSGAVCALAAAVWIALQPQSG